MKKKEARVKNEYVESRKHRSQLNASRISLFPDFVLSIVTVAYNMCVIQRDGFKKNPDRSLVGRDN